MASFSSNLRDFIKRYDDVDRKFSPDIARDWFMSKKIRMQPYHEKMFLGFKKVAVVLVGVSACGKSTFAKKFLEQHKGFEYISFDDCTFEASKEVEYRDVDVTDRALELLDAKFEEHKRHNIVVDGLVTSVEKRAALMKTLQEMRYKIYVIYFTDEYNEKHIKYNVIRRSVDHVLHAMMVASDPTKFVFLMSLRFDMVEARGNAEGLTEEELIAKYINDPLVKQEIKHNYWNYEVEREQMFIEAQEAAKAFMWGADYYYEVR